MQKILRFILLFILTIFIWYIWYVYYYFYNIDKDPEIISASKSYNSVYQPEFYNLSINDSIYLTYLLKIWYFGYDKNKTNDWVYNKYWEPLEYNYCYSRLWWDLYKIDWDFDNDWIINSKDDYPFDYSNNDQNIRFSDTLDFDNDWIKNKYDKDADGNWLFDLYQTLCFDMNNKKNKWFWWFSNSINILDSKEVEIKQKIEEIIKELINNDEFDKWQDINNYINEIFEKIKFSEDAIFYINDKEWKKRNFYISKKEILNNIWLE